MGFPTNAIYMLEILIVGWCGHRDAWPVSNSGSLPKRKLIQPRNQSQLAAQMAQNSSRLKELRINLRELINSSGSVSTLRELIAKERDVVHQHTQHHLLGPH